MEEMIKPNEIEVMQIQKENYELRERIAILKEENDYMRKVLNDLEKRNYKYEKTLKAINLLTENVGE